ncbi:hypothetical protein CH63R_14404 [Colletotrichum higginsianum IMI 349063]|uniref:F-box domain-containing protein n=1 Tax=Colletotrichum higginsianum (strain IMI 349063) TaxID=759273 RepID=A0A1B7XQR9_COLHI|nr:hypothetical protein CH63R_14404 [Colletotrichum higginsianum IMI 349063]OBR02103.1 hypothetical protein CH63R_14404 [Colletotrichum higginsianum IMI 349063]
MAVQLSPIGKMPLEIIHLIVFFLGQSTPDRKSTPYLKNLRLTWKPFKKPAEEILFHSVHLSLLMFHLEAFWIISKTPHLAIHVREIVWLENRRYQSDPVEEWLKTRQPPIPKNQITRVLDLFWEDDDIIDDYEEGSAIPAPDLITLGLKQLPRVATFVSYDMADWRLEPPKASDEYIFVVEAPYATEIPSEGFVRYLQPAMGHPESTVTSLVWKETLKPLEHPFSQAAFAGLTSIDIRFYELPQWKNMVDCLHAASNLEKLFLTSVHGHGRHIFQRICLKRWNCLTVVRFEGIGVSDDGLFDFVERHYTLNHLVVVRCSLGVKTKRRIQEMQRGIKTEFDADDGENQVQS